MSPLSITNVFNSFRNLFGINKSKKEYILKKGVNKEKHTSFNDKYLKVYKRGMVSCSDSGMNKSIIKLKINLPAKATQ